MDPAGQPLLQLQDIHLPPPPPWWPPAPGWWLLAVLIALGLLLLGPRLVAYRRRRRRRRQLLTLLAALERRLAADPAPEHLAGLSALLKRVALQHYPRQAVAGLHGPGWLDFLDRTGGEGAFADGPGRVLADGAYRPDLGGPLDVPGLVAAARCWLLRHSGEAR